MPKLRSSVLFHGFGAEGVLLDLESEECFRANRTGERALELVRAGHSLESIVEALLREFRVDRDRCERDVAAFLREIETLGLSENPA